MHCYPLVRVKNWLVMRMRPRLRGEDKYHHMLIVLSLMENRFDGTLTEKKHGFKNWLVLRMRRPLRFGGKMNILTCVWF